MVYINESSSSINYPLDIDDILIACDDPMDIVMSYEEVTEKIQSKIVEENIIEDF